MLFAGLGSTNKSAIFLLFSSYRKLCGRSGRNCLFFPPVSSDYNGFPDTHFYRGTTRLMSWPDSERYLRPLVLSWTGGVLFLQNFLTHRFPQFFYRGTCAPCVLSRLRQNGYSPLLGSYLSRIGRIENPSCSACGHSSQDNSHLILHCPATDSLRRSLVGDSLCLYDIWSRPWGVARLLGFHGLPPCPHPSEGVG